MRLARITLVGFKSFADKTEIVFDKPVTGIVGPNGCGKSNIVDAIKWVLGELSAKSLRGGAMMDMIFNGSGNRRPAGMASVTLTFDNPDRTLPLDMDDVSVTRQLYRDGSSEYLINRKRARLRDIRELFMDTGVGTEAYSIIEQGKVDVMLQANPDQRREIFEEAAGISRFKSRKKEAVRKLERAEQNLTLSRTRAQDLERRLRSVKAQATRARTYKELTAQLSDLQTRHILADYHRWRTRLAEVTDQAEQAEADRAAAARKLQTAEQAVADGEIEHQSAAQHQKQLDKQRMEAESEKQQAAQRKQMAESNLEHLSKQIEQDQQRVADLEKRAEHLKAERSEAAERVEKLQAQGAEAEAALKDAQDKSRELQHQLNERRSAIEDEKAGLVTLMRRSSQLQNEINSIDHYEKSLHASREKLDRRSGEVSDELESLLSTRDHAKAKIEEVDQLLADEKEKLQQIEQELSQLGDRQADIAKRLARAKEKRSALDSRRTLLQEMEQRQEGVNEAVKVVLARKASDNGGSNSFAFVRGLLAEMLETDLEHAPLVEAALADYEQALVIDRLLDLTEKADAIDSLSGRVTFLPLDQFFGDADLRSRELIHAARTTLPANIRRVSELVRCEDWLRPIVDDLLGRTLVVPNLDSAVMLRAVMPQGVRFITKDGRLLESDGRITAGPPSDVSRGGMISRRSELHDLDQQIASLDQTIAEEEQTVAQLGDRTGHLTTLSQELRQSIYDANAVRVELSSRLESVDTQIQKLEREQPVLSAETEKIHEQLREADDKRKSHEQDAEQVEQESQQRQQRVEKLEAGLGDLQAELEAAQEHVTATRVETGKLAEQLTAAQRQVRDLETTEADVVRQQKLLDDQLSHHRERIADLEETRDEAAGTAHRLAQSLQQLQVQCDLAQRRLDKADAAMAELRQQLKPQRQAVEELDRQINKHHVDRREIEVKLESIRDRASENLSIELEEAYEDYEPEEIDWPAVEAEIKDLRARIGRLGNVNVDAIEELDQLEQEHVDLAEQIEDIENGRAQLEQLIKQINEDSRKRFEATFEQIKENFAGQQGLFRKLFGGGRADIVLQPDEEGRVDVLESGIEIIAKPPGKEPRSISLLSGGEKTMTAVALLLSIFKSRPSPFAILDEVDAALDESNVDRFSQIIRSFLDSSHFIVITHNKGTMSVCDELYGITMQERGVSKRVSVRFDQVSSDGEISQEAIEASDAADEAAEAEPEVEESMVEEDAELEIAAASPDGNGNGNGNGHDHESQEQGEDAEPEADETSKPRRSIREQLAEMIGAGDKVEVDASNN